MSQSGGELDGSLGEGNLKPISDKQLGALEGDYDYVTNRSLNKRARSEFEASDALRGSGYLRHEFSARKSGVTKRLRIGDEPSDY